MGGGQVLLTSMSGSSIVPTLMATPLTTYCWTNLWSQRGAQAHTFTPASTTVNVWSCYLVVLLLLS